MSTDDTGAAKESTARRGSARQQGVHAGEEPGSQWRQYLVTLLVNLSSFATGVVYGWPAPILPALQSEQSPVGLPPITDEDASWLASIHCLSRILTIPLYMLVVDRYGCKAAGYLVAAPLLLSFGLALFASSVSMLYWARFVCGISAGGAAIMVPSYTIDIAEDGNKGKLGVIYAQAMNVGMVFAYVVGYYASYAVFHACSMAAMAAFVGALLWLPESPLFLMTAGRTEEARLVLRWLRGGRGCESELERMRTRAQQVLEKRQRKMSASELADRRMLRGLFICLGLTLNQQMSGIGPIVSYTVSIFQQAGSVIPPHVATIFLGLLMIVGTHLSSVAVERWGRRPLLISSDAVVTACLVAVGAYFYLQALGLDVSAAGWLPVAALSLYILSTGVGLGPLPFTIATELVHPNHRGLVQAANVVMLSVSTFVPTLAHVPLAGVAGQAACFWTYAGFCAAGTVAIYFTLPETKGRSLEDVLRQMDSDHFVRSILSYDEGKGKEPVPMLDIDKV